MSGQSTKRALSSTSECEADTSALDNTVFSDKQSPVKKPEKKKKKQSDKQKKLVDFFESKKTSEVETKSDKMEQKLEEINNKLKNILTKDDTSFIKDIIKATVNELKEELLKPVIQRVEILEGEIHTKQAEVDKYKKDLEDREKEVADLKTANESLNARIKTEEEKREKEINELEQYGRRNNIRIYEIPNDSEKQNSASVAAQVIATLNEKGKNLNLREHDIDIAHRLGPYDSGKCRPVIVKFVRRQTKIEVMMEAKGIKGKGVFIYEDLTWLNQQVLSSVRLKDKERVEKCWSFEGQLYVKYKRGTAPVKIQYKEFSYWLSKPWPAKSG